VEEGEQPADGVWELTSRKNGIYLAMILSPLGGLVVLRKLLGLRLGGNALSGQAYHRARL
jgi:hypothetical protein